MGDSVVISVDTLIGAQMADAAEKQRIVFFAGLPGVGKSLFLQQQTLMAASAGRRVHLMQWDTARAAFETRESLACYPEIDGFTHPAIRKAVGLWARHGILRWHEAFPGAEHLLVGELPIVGNRLVELVQKHDDDVEQLLCDASATFFVPVPSKTIRERIEAAREASIARPRHEREKRDAPINVVQANWMALYDLAVRLDLAGELGAAQGNLYDPLIYARVFKHLLRHRNCNTLSVETLFPVSGSVYDLDVKTQEITATEIEVANCFANLARKYTDASIREAVEDWHHV
ncbi:MAG: hypothetical protein HY066_15280 [Betaproteobacteria bacterium]|nr:hypothetical protein [Betaproteobacteria bacterium]